VIERFRVQGYQVAEVTIPTWDPIDMWLVFALFLCPIEIIKILRLADLASKESNNELTKINYELKETGPHNSIRDVRHLLPSCLFCQIFAIADFLLSYAILVNRITQHV
jgi:hypothetical protein